MAVKEALLGILTLGPAYGLQLHAELCQRAPHRSRTNVGQIYGTLERQIVAGLVVRFGETADGLPLYSLTEKGHEHAEGWLTGHDLTVVNDWPELLDRVLIARSLSGTFLEAIIGAYEIILTTERPTVSLPGQGLSALAAAATARFEGAALGWLGDVRRDMTHRSHLEKTDEQADDWLPAGRGYNTDRPKRGRPAQIEATPRKKRLSEEAGPRY
jgi:DNA-binding PadR family transcriptional regulator